MVVVRLWRGAHYEQYYYDYAGSLKTLPVILSSRDPSVLKYYREVEDYFYGLFAIRLLSSI